ncbi:MAG: winged helix-turn-helix transcriptional regulator [Candidatus Eisenbacteria bacterium]|nr:winged helix-turn-helix transcriptional regulator [Candidatus Eisenbacteria bacterium]
MTTSLLDAQFAALADPTRRSLVARLADGESTLTELAEPLAMSVPAVSKHLRTLERAGLVKRGHRSSVRPIRLVPGGLSELVAWVDRHRNYWESSFERLDSLLGEPDPETEGRDG